MSLFSFLLKIIFCYIFRKYLKYVGISTFFPVNAHISLSYLLPPILGALKEVMRMGNTSILKTSQSPLPGLLFP